MDVEILLRRLFASGNLASDFLPEDLRAAAGQGIQPR